MTTLDNEKLGKVAGGMKNPVSGVSFEGAMKKAKELGHERKDMGGWTQMNDVDYLTWWKDCNKEEYENHKDVIDAMLNVKNS